MGIENPYNKLNKEREKSDKRKLDGARNPGVLNPRGLGGPIFDEMKDSFDTLGTSDKDEEKVRRLRNLFESKLHRRGLKIYNEHLQGEKGAPSHAKFEADVEESFRRGFDSYLKVALRLDEKDAPDPHGKYKIMIHGMGPRMIGDEHDNNYYLKNYLIKGNEVAEDLTSHDHNFEPVKDFEGYANKYQRTSNKSDGQAAMDAYMFEKLRLFSSEFFDMLDESLRRGINYKNAVELASYVYGNNANIYEEMEGKGLDANVIAWQSWSNRARVRVPFERYLDIGPELEKKYPYVRGASSWVASPNMIRNLIFKHPNTAEQGLAIVNHELPRLKELFPNIPQKLIIDTCVSSPDQYEENIRALVDQAEVIMREYPMTEEYGEAHSQNPHVFEHYKLQGPLMVLMDRTSVKKRSKEIERALDSFLKVIDRAYGEEVDLTYSARRRVLRSLLSYSASPEKVLKRELREAGRRLKQYGELVSRAEKIDEVWGEFYVEFGSGGTGNERLEYGQLVVELVKEQYGEEDGEEYLINIMEMYHLYVSADFSEDINELDALKDALVMDPYNTKEFYEKTLERKWPEGIEEVVPKDNGM